MDNIGNELVRMLKGLEVEQIREVQRRLKEKYPEDKKLLLQCQTAIGMRREQEKRNKGSSATFKGEVPRG